MSLFRRRKKLSRWVRLRRFVWPSMGWGRIFRYWTFKLKRLQGSPYAIACGFACGASVSFTPFIGFHFILAAVLAWAMRGNLIASAIGTAVGNPWTFPFIWAGIMWIGTWILGYERGQDLSAELTFDAIFEEPGTVLLPMLVGGLPTGVIVWLLFFFPIRRVVGNYQHHRQARRLRRRRVLEEERRAREGQTQAAQGEVDDLSIPDSAEPVATNVTHLDQVMGDRGR
jgi:hypothetical protein